MRVSFLLLLLTIVTNLLAQNGLILSGKVTDESGKAVEYVNIAIANSSQGTISDMNGAFSLSFTQSLPIQVHFSCIGYSDTTLILTGDLMLNQPLVVQLKTKTEIIEGVDVKGEGRTDQSFQRIDPTILFQVPDATGGSVEALVKTQIGVASNNELSSQYRVRGGNYDENLVYVNDIEIYRPFLVRSGQQEGLSFANPNMVSRLKFSPGGFDVSYGDKLSSVLDIQYKRPSKYAGSIQASLLGVNGHVEGATKDGKFSHITGIRYKTNQYLLGSLDTKGDYSPTYIDLQSFLNYRITSKWSVDILGYYSQNDYRFVPTSRETSFGTLSDIKQLMVYFEGEEKDLFQTGFIAGAFNYSPNQNNHYKLTATGYSTFEEESFDILGEYWLQELDPISGKALDPKAPVTGIGVGGFLQHARNDLFGQVGNIAIKGIHQLENHRLSWELKLQHESFQDNINEWELRDSSGYSLPYNDENIQLSYSYNTHLSTSSQRVTGYLMDDFTYQSTKGALSLNYGMRFHYWSFNEELLFSPRFNVNYRPQWKRQVDFRLAGGFYFQPPFYKELRMSNGELNHNIQAQKSLHLVAGSDLYFKAWERPFKFTSEIYYKHLSNLISYQVDNVRIRYSGVNDAEGYATGIDFKIDGEFVEGVESWASLGIMKTEEDILKDRRITTDSEGNQVITHPGNIPRPSDQRINFALFFQDYLPNNPTFKVHLNLLFGSGLPFGPPKSERYQATFRTPPYRRADLGFSKDLTANRINGNHFFKKLWLGLEVFNLFNISNTISYYWVTDVNNRQYAVPNYLTSRRLNIQLVVNF